MSYIVNPALRTLCICVLLIFIVTIICKLDPGQIMTEFEELKQFYYKEKLNSVTSGVRPLYVSPLIWFSGCCSYSKVLLPLPFAVAIACRLLPL